MKKNPSSFTKAIIREIFVFAFLSIGSFGCGSELPSYKAKLNSNRLLFSREAEAFFQQQKIRNITRVDSYTYNISGDIITLNNQQFENGRTINSENVDIVKHDFYQNFDSFLNSKGLTRQEFFRWADFLKEYDLFSLSTDKRLVFIGFYGGLMGSESGLFYVPMGSENAVKNFYPTWPESISYVEKIDDRWYYYVD